MNDRIGAVAQDGTQQLTVEFFFDLICPWCLIGKHQLEKALELVARERPKMKVSVRWKSLPLLPQVPSEGLPYHEFYLRRLGGAMAVAARRRQVRDAGETAGVDFDFERIEKMPNTIAAHRLVEHAGRLNGDAFQSRLIERLFDGYFKRGEDIGDTRVLAAIGEECGLERSVGLAVMEPDERDSCVRKWHSESARYDISGVPGFVIQGRTVQSGAMPPAMIARAILDTATV